MVIVVQISSLFEEEEEKKEMQEKIKNKFNTVFFSKISFLRGKENFTKFTKKYFSYFEYL